MPATFSWFVIADKINATTTPESKLGQFITKYAEDNIGGMIISWPFGTILQGTVFSGVYVWMNTTITSGPLYLLLFTLYNVAYYAILVLIVHYLRPVFAKAPFLRGLLYWDKITIFDKERAEVAAAAEAKQL